MANVFIKDTQAWEGGLSRQFDRKAGFNTKRHFEGSQSYILSKEIEAIALGYNTEVTQGAVWKLDCTIPAKDDGSDGGQGDQPIDNWETFANAIEKDLLRSDSTAIAGLSAGDVTVLRDLLDGNLSAKDINDAPADFFDFGGGDTTAVFRLIATGWKSKRIYQQVLRHTRTISNSYQVPAALTRVGQVYSTAKLIAEQAMFPIIAGTLPTSGYTTRTDGVQLFNGWLKGFPTISASAYGKSQIVQEWEWGEWAATAYTIYT